MICKKGKVRRDVEGPPEPSMLNKLDRDLQGVLAGDAKGWRRARGDAPLSEVNRTISVRGATVGRRLAAFLGPGYLVAVGYMDPGNWATSLAGGSKFGYTLLVVSLVSNIMAIVLQALCARLAIGLNLLFGIPLEIGVLLTAFDVFLILYLQRLGFRYLEALIITLLGVITVCFAVQIALASPEWG